MEDDRAEVVADRVQVIAPVAAVVHALHLLPPHGCTGHTSQLLAGSRKALVNHRSAVQGTAGCAHYILSQDASLVCVLTGMCAVNDMLMHSCGWCNSVTGVGRCCTLQEAVPETELQPERQDGQGPVGLVAGGPLERLPPGSTSSTALHACAQPERSFRQAITSWQVIM